MNTLSERIELILSENKDKINQVDLAKIAGVTKALVGQWKSGATQSINPQSAVRISKELGYDPLWLMLGHPYHQKKLREYAQPLLGNVQQNHEKYDTNTESVNLKNGSMRKIPLINYVQAGLMTEAVDIYEIGGAEEYLSTTKKVGDNAFALKIRGNSMSPIFMDGDRIIVDPAVAPTPGKYVVAKNGHEEATFKKYQLRGIDEQGNEIFELVPLNSDYPSMRSDQMHLVIIGTAVEVHKAI